MPFQIGSVAVHDDGQHFGSSKRDVANGVAGLNVNGDVMGKGASVQLARLPDDRIAITERTSSEWAMYLLRNSTGDFDAYIYEGGSPIQVQTGSMKNVANGIAALDASGFILAAGAGIKFPRNGSDDVHIYEKTSGEEAYAFHRTAANDYTFFIKESNVWRRFQTETMKDVASGIAGLDASAQLAESVIPGILEYYKLADDILHSHDAGVSHNTTTYTLKKTITIDHLYPTPSTLRVKFDLKTSNGAVNAYGKIYKNSVAVGTERVTMSTSYVTFSEDISFASGDTIELYLKCAVPAQSHAQNLQVFGETSHTLGGAIVLGDVGEASGFTGVNS